MKLTTRGWTDVQSMLEEIKPNESALLVAHIEQRTWGKMWSASVAIGLHKSDEAMVNEALAALEKERADIRAVADAEREQRELEERKRKAEPIARCMYESSPYKRSFSDEVYTWYEAAHKAEIGSPLQLHVDELRAYALALVDAGVIRHDAVSAHESSAGVVNVPKPDWASSNVQPKGEIVGKPSKNGKRVAARPE